MCTGFKNLCQEVPKPIGQCFTKSDQTAHHKNWRNRASVLVRTTPETIRGCLGQEIRHSDRPAIWQRLDMHDGRRMRQTSSCTALHKVMLQTCALCHPAAAADIVTDNPVFVP